MNGLPSDHRVTLLDILPVVVKCGIRTIYHGVLVSHPLLRATCLEVCRPSLISHIKVVGGGEYLFPFLSFDLCGKPYVHARPAERKAI